MPADQVIMVGDSKDDTQAGRNAGAQTVLLVSDANEHLMDHEHTDIYVKRYGLVTKTACSQSHRKLNIMQTRRSHTTF